MSTKHIAARLVNTHQAAVYLTEPTSPETHPLTLGTLHHNDLSVVFAYASAADSTLAHAARNLLRSMGKDDSVTGMRMHASDSVHIAPIWLIAHRTRLVVVASAQIWPANVMTEFLRLVLATPASVLLVADHGRSHEVAKTCIGYTPVAKPWSEVAEAAQTANASAPTPPPAEQPVPRSDWLTYRADCREQLDDHQFADLDAHYLASLRAAQTALHATAQVDDHTVASILRAATQTSATVNEAITAFRATQAAFFDAGINLRIDPDRLIALLANSRRPAYTETDWLSLRAYRDPVRPAICTLYGYHLNVDQIATFRVGHARAALAEGRLNNQPLHEHARIYLAAQTLRRALEDADEAEPLIELSTIGAALTTAARDTGVLIAGPHNHNSDHTRKLWHAGSGYLYGRIS